MTRVVRKSPSSVLKNMVILLYWQLSHLANIWGRHACLVSKEAEIPWATRNYLIEWVMTRWLLYHKDELPSLFNTEEGDFLKTRVKCLTQHRISVFIQMVRLTPPYIM